MNFAPYQSSPPEHSRSFSPPSDRAGSNPRPAAKSPRSSADIGRTTSPTSRAASTYRPSPPPLQHPRPQRGWAAAGVAGLDSTRDHAAYRDQDEDYVNDDFEARAGFGSQSGGGIGGFSGRGTGGIVSEFDTSLGLRLDHEAALAYLVFPPLSGIFLLIAERNSDYVRYHAWQSALLFTCMMFVHLLLSWSSFLTWIAFIADLAFMAGLAVRAYQDADTLDRYEIPFFGRIASRFLDDE